MEEVRNECEKMEENIKLFNFRWFR